MSWQGIEGHDRIVEQFRTSIAGGRLGSTFLFVGPAGIGKRTFAVKMAQSLFCQSSNGPLAPCGSCPPCVQVTAGTHPDLELIRKPDDKSVIPIDLLIGNKQNRMREGLCARIAMKPQPGGRKFAIIDDADFLNQEGANSLLKTLEEPPPGSILVLIGTSPQRQLPTIRSRCQTVRFQPLSLENCANLLLQHEIVDSAEQAQSLAQLSGGSLARAADWNHPDLWEFRTEFMSTLSKPGWDAPFLAKQIGEFVDAAGKEAPKRRARLRLVMEMALQFFTQTMRHTVGATLAGDAELHRSAANYAAAAGLSAETLAACVERTQLARQHIDQNANQATNIDAWVDDLSQMVTHRLVTAVP